VKSDFVCKGQGCPARKHFSLGYCCACYYRKRKLDKLLTSADKGHPEPVPDRHHYPFANLEALLPEAPSGVGDYVAGRHYWQDTLGVFPQQVTKWRSRGLSWRTADKLACHIGIHPGLIWPDWFERGFMDGRMSEEESAA
jgi:hypothetical protein